MYASSRGETEIAKLLIAKGADVNIRSDKGETALSLAVSHYNEGIVQLLRKAGAK
jgi:ankyrin repeat protein